MTPSEFTVTFSRDARALDYDDPQGHLVFTFDLGSAGNKSICLEHFSSQTQRVPRYRLAFERTKEFLESCGYQVEVYGAFAPAPTTTAPDVTARIAAELASHELPRDFASDIRARLVTPTRSEFKLRPENTVWDMWLVFQEPVHGLRIVFDEHSKQFGVAEQDVFLGFYGTFIQTLDAISNVA